MTEEEEKEEEEEEKRTPGVRISRSIIYSAHIGFLCSLESIIHTHRVHSRNFTTINEDNLEDDDEVVDDDVDGDAYIRKRSMNEDW